MTENIGKCPKSLQAAFHCAVWPATIGAGTLAYFCLAKNGNVQFWSAFGVMGGFLVNLAGHLLRAIYLFVHRDNSEVLGRWKSLSAWSFGLLTLQYPIALALVYLLLNSHQSQFDGTARPLSVAEITPTCGPFSREFHRTTFVPILSAPPEITSELENGFCDLVFYIQEYEARHDGTQLIQGTGTYRKRPLAFELILGSTWTKYSMGDGISAHLDLLTYQSVGLKSNNFLESLDELFATHLKPKAMRRKTQFSGISLEGDPRNLKKGPVRIKTFFDPDDGSRRAELYSTIIFSARKFYIGEKDPGYRSNIIRALTTN